DRDAEALDARGLLLPEVDAEVALVLERGVEHALGGHDPAVADLVRRPVGHHGDVVSVRLETEGQLEPRLAGTDEKYPAHACLLSPVGSARVHWVRSGWRSPLRTSA